MKKIFTLMGIVALLYLLPGCNVIDDKTGSLVLNFTMEQQPRTLLPPIDMEPAGYSIAVTGPDNTVFHIDSVETTAVIEHLAFGTWTVAVSAKNSADTIIGYEEVPAVIHTGETTVVDVIITPLAGTGALNLEVNWNAGDTEYPALEGVLIPPSGAAIDLDFTISDNNHGTCVNDSIAAGFYTLVVKLMDGNPGNTTPLLTMGAVEVVRIVKDQITSGVFNFTEINKPGGNTNINIIPDMKRPIEVSLIGALDNLITGGEMTLTAAVPDGTANVVYVWYINGRSAGTGESYTVSGSAPGIYRIDVTVFSADGLRAGSASHTFHVADAIPAAWSYTREITIDNTNNPETLTDYQVLVSVDTQALIAGGKLNADGSDIRFLDENMNYLSYWIEPGIQNESGLNRTNTRIWVKVPLIPALSSNTLYMEYGNSAARAVSDIKSTFIFGDDFNDNALDASLWTVVLDNQGVAGEINGRFEHNSPQSDPQSNSFLHSANYLTGAFILESRFKKGGYVYRGIRVINDSGDNSAGIYISDCCSVDFGVTVAGESATVIAEPDFWSREYNPEYYLSIIHKPDGTFTLKGSVPAFEPGGPKNWEQTFTQVMPLDIPLKFEAYEYVWKNAWWLWERYEDDIRVRKYTTIEPTTMTGIEIVKTVM